MRVDVVCGVVDAVVVVVEADAFVVVGATVSESPPQAEAHKNKQTTTRNFFIFAIFAHNWIRSRHGWDWWAEHTDKNKRSIPISTSSRQRYELDMRVLRPLIGHLKVLSIVHEI